MSVERRIAGLLEVGTWSGCGAIAVGLVAHESNVVSIGVAGLIALPVIRVVMMLVELARIRDYRLVTMCVVVLAAIAIGCALA